MSSERRGLPSVLLLAGLVSGCLELHEDQPAAEVQECARCHGDVGRSGAELLQAAPPFDLQGNEDPAYPGVGAHDRHLLGSATHGPIACDECHVVPNETRSPGHIDTSPPAELVFGELARGEGDPHYDARSRRCSDTYCHASSTQPWTRPRPSEQACGSCHGLPPALPHPQAADCSTCHGAVVDDALHFVAPELHVNGRVEFVEPSCTGCHGGTTPAPPRDLSGQTSATARGVGAHSVHLEPAHARPVACAECHLVPEALAAPGHLDGSGVDLAFSGVAASLGRSPSFDGETLGCSDTWCHGPSASAPSPGWTAAAPLACTGCHGMPPAAPHPAMENCSACHAEVAALAITDDAVRVVIAEPALHVNGQVEVSSPDECSACHGDASRADSTLAAAPPRDTFGREGTAGAGVGAHAAHLVENGRARSLACEECHTVPSTTGAPGHIDTVLPAEVTFSGIAFAFDASPSYEAGTCRNTYCHGGAFIGGRPSGGNHVHPSWTEVDGSRETCNGCHGMPPPLPHPDAADCSRCHHDIGADLDFLRPELHVDGTVTFFLPE